MAINNNNKQRLMWMHAVATVEQEHQLSNELAKKNLTSFFASNLLIKTTNHSVTTK